MTEPGSRTPEVPPPAEDEAAGTGGIGRVDDQSATPPHGDEARGAAYNLSGESGEGRDEPRSPSGT